MVVYMHINMRRDTNKTKDTAAMKALPSVAEMQRAVTKGFAYMRAIACRFAGTPDPLSPQIQGHVNACLIGGMYLSMFAGRNGEWERLPLKTIQDMIAAGEDFFLTEDHKTARTYGSIAKWFTPGMMSAVKAYLSLPRRPDIKTFLVPPGKDTKVVSIPGALKTFACNMFHKDKTHPTVNLMRKFFHTQLMGLARTSHM